MMPRRYNQLPPVVQTPLDDIWEVVVPIARANLVNNPSFETNTTNWTAIGGSIARSTTQQYHGAYSLAITPTSATTDGARFDTWSSTSGTLYAYSAKVFGQAGIPYKLCLETTGAVELASVAFRGTGRWQWIYGYYLETATTTRRVTIRKNSSADTHTFYLDGVQVEAITAGEIVSTYIDGDLLGLVPNQQPPAYVWNGTPHASTSSRSGLTRAGGMVFRFKDFGFFLSAIIGLGLAIPQNVATEYAHIDGGFDDYTRKPSRQFTITGNFHTQSYQELRDMRGGLAAYFDRDLAGLDQQLILRHHIEDPCGNILSDVARIPCKYVQGLGGNTNNQVAETAAISFIQYQPIIQSDGEAGASLAVQTSTANTNNIAKRTASGVWQTLSTGLNSSVQDILIAKDGGVYVTGAFSTAGGGAAAAIAKWDPITSTWSALGTGLTGGGATGYALAQAPNGDIYVGGDFTDAGGSGADYIAKWNGSTWSVVGSATAINNIVRCLAIGPTGIVYAGGEFTDAGADPNADKIAQWNGSAWSALGSGMNDVVRSIVVAPDSTIYATGDFTTADGNSAVKIAKWNGSAWSAMSTGLTGGGTNRGFKLALGKNGILYVGGTFTSAGGVGANNIAQWNGVVFAPLGSGVNNSVRNMVVLPDNQIIAKGDFTSAGGFTITGGTARWNGSAWVPVESDMAGGSVAAAIALTPGGDLYISTNAATMTSQGLTTITAGTAQSFPIIIIKGPSSGTSRIYSLINNTTNRAIYLNYTINAGETAVFVFRPDSLSFVSDFLGSIARYIMAGSSEAIFFLQPGSNSIGVFSAGSTVTAIMHWQQSYASLDDVP